MAKLGGMTLHQASKVDPLLTIWLAMYKKTTDARYPQISPLTGCSVPIAEAMTRAPVTAMTYKAKIKAKDFDRVHDDVSEEFIHLS
jgi:hypothetical protein